MALFFGDSYGLTCVEKIDSNSKAIRHLKLVIFNRQKECCNFYNTP